MYKRPVSCQELSWLWSKLKYWVRNFWRDSAVGTLSINLFLICPMQNCEARCVIGMSPLSTLLGAYILTLQHLVGLECPLNLCWDLESFPDVGLSLHHLQIISALFIRQIFMLCIHNWVWSHSNINLAHIYWIHITCGLLL